MAYERWTKEEAEHGTNWFKLGHSYFDIATELSTRFGTSRTSEKVRDAIRKGLWDKLLNHPCSAEDRAPHRVEVTEDGATTITANRPYSEEELAQLFGIDTSLYHCTKFISNVWGQNWQSKAFWAPNELNILADRWEDLLANLTPLPALEPPALECGSDTFYEMCLFDAHFGLLAWAPEAGEDDDLYLTTERYRRAFRYFKERMPANVEYVVWCIGQDLFHFDQLVKNGSGGATANGTVQDVDSRWMKLFTQVCQVHVDLIRQLRGYEDGKRVVIKIQPGNHDTQTAFYLGEYLRAMFSEDPYVDIDNSPAPRKYHVDGEVVLGYTHGHREKPVDLYRLMTKETGVVRKFMEWHRGHLHHENVQQHGDMTIRGMRALTLPDAWHKEQGYTSISGAQAFLWHRHVGLLGQDYWTPAVEREGL